MLKTLVFEPLNRDVVTLNDILKNLENAAQHVIIGRKNLPACFTATVEHLPVAHLWLKFHIMPGSSAPSRDVLLLTERDGGEGSDNPSLGELCERFPQALDSWLFVKGLFVPPVSVTGIKVGSVWMSKAGGKEKVGALQRRAIQFQTLVEFSDGEVDDYSLL